jgi:hypothetical protein
MLDHLKHMVEVRSAGPDRDAASWAMSEIERLRRHADELQAKVTCMCGDDIDHSPWAGHNPVSMFDYAVAQEVERQIGDVRSLAEAASTVLADWTADCKVDDESIVQLLTAFNGVGCQRALLAKVEAAVSSGSGNG